MKGIRLLPMKLFILIAGSACATTSNYGNSTNDEAAIRALEAQEALAVLNQDFGAAETVKPIGKAPMAGQTVQRRFTSVWKKEGGGWRLLARHANNIIAAP